MAKKDIMITIGIAHLLKNNVGRVIQQSDSDLYMCCAFSGKKITYLSRSRTGLYTIVSHEETTMCQTGL
jgi:hypothetical protein